MSVIYEIGVSEVCNDEKYFRVLSMADEYSLDEEIEDTRCRYDSLYLGDLLIIRREFDEDLLVPYHDYLESRDYLYHLGDMDKFLESFYE